MNIQKIKKLQLDYKIALWSGEDKYKIRDAYLAIKNEIKIPYSRGFRGSMGAGGKQNRRQRAHTKAGGSIYRKGLHWMVAENY